MVHVTFIDERSGAAFAVTEMPASDLPESFLVSTDFEIEGQSWSVVSAAPPLRSEFEKSQELELRLVPIELVNPEKILFSLPTICAELPASDGAAADGSELVIWEDDWRQTEFVSAEYASEVRTEMEAIARVYSGAVEGAGFREIHARDLISRPISSPDLSQQTIDTLFGPPEPSIRFKTEQSRISDTSYHLLQPGWVLYTHLQHRCVNTLGLWVGAEELADLDPQDAEKLNRISTEFGLLLVDWCSGTIHEPGTLDLRAANFS